jgi:hypothetical protein
MAAERRAAADELAASQQSARQSAYLRNLAAETDSRAATGRWLHEKRARAAAGRRLQEERAGAVELVRAREHQYPLPSYHDDADIIEDAQRHRQQLREECLHCRLGTSNHGGSAPATDGADSPTRATPAPTSRVVGSMIRISSSVYSACIPVWDTSALNSNM